MKPERPFEDHHGLFLGEERGSCTASELLRLAEAIRRRLPKDSGQVVAIFSSSASFIVAGILALWSEGLEPLILDPGLKQEPTSVFEAFPEMPVLADEPSEFLSKVHIVEGPVPDGDSVFCPCWPADDRVAIKFFTSGSMGEPKIIDKFGYQFFRQMEQEIDWLGCGPGLKVMSMVPPFHILGNIYGFFLPLMTGGSTAYLHNALPSRWASHIRDQQPDLVIGVPSHYRFLVNTIEQPLPEALYLSSGAPLSPQVAQDFQRRAGHDIWQIYGSTENGGIGKRCGFGSWEPFPGLKWRTREADGRLMVFSKWQEKPEQWTVTDDLAEIGEDGTLTLLGRADSIVKVGGKRFSTNEIIQIVENSGLVESAVAVMYERFGENAIALFASGEGDRKDLESRLRLELANRLAAFKVPRTIRVLNKMPLLGNGKIDRQALRIRVAHEA